jgi:aspartyl-tRNA synthetase
METIPEEDTKEVIEFNNTNPELEKMMVPSNSPQREENPILGRLGFREGDSDEVRSMRRKWWKRRLLEQANQQNPLLEEERRREILQRHLHNSLQQDTVQHAEQKETLQHAEQETQQGRETAGFKHHGPFYRPPQPHLFSPDFANNAKQEENDDFWGSEPHRRNAFARQDESVFRRRRSSFEDLYNDEPNDEEFDRRTGCAICRSKFYPYDEITKLQCSHRFHTQELKQWLAINNSCPSCGFTIEPTNSEINLEEDTDVDAEPWQNNPIEYNLMRSESDEDILGNSNFDNTIELLCRVYSKRDQKGMVFLVLKYYSHTIQALVFKKSVIVRVPQNLESDTDVNSLMSHVTNQSVIKVTGKLVKSPVPIKSTEVSFTDREIHIQQIELISKSEILPVQINDINWTTDVGQDTCLNNRVLDLRSRSKQATFALQSYLSQYMREFLYAKGFIEIHTPKLTSVSSEGGAEVFQTNYFGRPAYLAQSPQLYKQMAINGDFPKVFEIGPVFRAEKSNTKRHLTEFTGFDMEMRLENSYEEVLDIFYEMLSTVFSKLYSLHSDLIFKARNTEAFALEMKKCVITYQEAIQMLNNTAPEGEPQLGPFDDINHAQEYRLGQLVKNLYKTDMFVLDKFPTSLRPFYTMPCKDNPNYSNSYDIIFRGQEVLSGAQRIHSYQDLCASAFSKGLTQDSMNNMSFYFESFKYGVYPHAGGGFGLERLIESFLDLSDIRMVSMFPRDPKRLEP